MNGSVSVGTLSAVLAVRDEFSAQIAKFEERIRAVESSAERVQRKTKSETDKIGDAYRKVAASLDPVVANSQKYERAQQSLAAALRAGIITQEQHNRSLDKARDKYLSASAPVLTWREEIQGLSGHISGLTGLLGPVGRGIDSLVGNLGSVAASTAVAGQGMSAFGAVCASVSGIVGKAATAVNSLLLALTGPVIAAAAALAAAVGLIFVEFKAIELGVKTISNAVQEGLKTQIVIERLNNALAANGSASGLSAAQMVAYAESLELVTARSKEEIVAAETILSRFDSLGKDAFPRALDATLAYAKAMGITADAAANKLGPAFEGSTRSLNSLREAGIVFSAGQRKTLTDMLEAGKIVEYQTLLFDLLREKVGTVGNEYDNNLTRQVGRARAVLGDFNESIASEVIPALEDLVEDLVATAGGWDFLKFAITNAGKEIGGVVRSLVYGVIISYHEWMLETDKLVFGISGAFRDLAEVMAGFATVMSASPLPGAEAWEGVAVSARKAVAGLADTQEDAKESALKHSNAIVTNTKKLIEHRTALEGDKKAYNTVGSSIDSVNSKNREAIRLQEQLNKVLAQQAEEARYLSELQALADRGLGVNSGERLKEEQRINDEHEYRISLLRLQEQFGSKIGKHLADQEKALKEWRRGIKLDFIIKAQIEPIDLTDTINDLFKESEQSLAAFTDELRSFIDITNQNEEAFQRQRDEVDAWWTDFADGWRESFRTTREIVDTEMGAVKQAVRDGFLTAAEGERALWELRQQQLEQSLSDWGTFIGFLGDMFGGVFKRISSAISNIQSAYSQGKQLDASGFGGMMSGSWGAIFAEVQLFYEAYKAVSNSIKRENARTFGDVTQLEIVGGNWSSPSYFSRYGQEFDLAIRDLVKSIEASMSSMIEDMGQITIRARKDQKEFSAYVAGVWVGTFKDAQTAMQEAVNYALTHATFDHIGPEFAQALEASIGKTFEQLQQNLEAAAIARRARIGDAGTDYIETVDRWRREMDIADSAGLSIDRMIEARDRELEALKNNVLGIDTAVSDQLRALRSLTEGIGESAETLRDTLEEKVERIRRTIARLEQEQRIRDLGLPGDSGSGYPTGGSNNGNRSDRGDGDDPMSAFLKSSADEYDAQIEELRRSLERYLDELGKIPEALSDFEIDLGIFNALYKYLEGSSKYSEQNRKNQLFLLDLEFAKIRKEIELLGRWEEFAGMFNDAYQAAREQAGRPRGGGSGDSKQGVRDFIDDKKFELSLVGMSEYLKSQKEIDRQYDDLIKQAGKDKKLREELLALKERELALLAEEQRRRVAGNFKEFVSPTSDFDKIRQTAQDLIKDISDSPFGDERKARMIARILAGIEDQITQLSRQMAVGLFGDLLSDMEKFGASEEQMSEIRRNMAIIEHTLNVENYRMRIEMLKAEGKLAPEIIASLEAAFGFISGINISDWLANGNRANTPAGGGEFAASYLDASVNNVTDSLNDLAEAFRDAKDDIRTLLDDIARGDLGIVSPESAFNAARDQYNDVLNRARAGELVGFQESSGAARNFIEALKRFSPALAAVELPRIQSELSQLLNATTVRDENLVYSERFAANQQQTNEALHEGFTDLSNRSHEQFQMQVQMVAQLQQLNSSNAELNARLVRMESENMANKRQLGDGRR